MLENDFTHTDSNVASGSRNTHLSPSFEIFDLEDESHPTPNGHVNATQVASGSGSGSGEKLKHRSKPTRSMINPQATHLKQHPERGNGVFATHHIAPGTIIEESPVLIITKEQWEEGKMDDCILGEYGFCWRGGGMGIGLGSGKIFPVNDKKVQDVNPGSWSWSTKPKPDDDQVRLVTELASLFNHSSSPNVNYVRDFEKSVIRFTASRAIQAGEELCICYAADESKLWFINSDEKRQRSEGSEEEAVIFPPEELVELLDEEADEERRAAEEKKIARQKRLEMMQGVPREAGRREMKKAKFFEKRKAAQEAEEAKLNGIEPKVIAPTPIRPPPSASTSTSSTPSRISTPLYPAIPERTVESPSLPPPLHSTKGKSRHEHDGPVILTPELEWDDQTSAEGEEEWAGIERIKGFTEREEDEALENDSALMDVWVVNVYEPTIVREVLRFSKERLRSEPELKHIKRVCRRRNAEGVQEEMSRVALCSVTEVDHQTLSQSISEFSPVLASLDPYIVSIPKTPAHDQSQLITKHAIWPVTLAPFQRKQDSSPRFWSLARRKWVEAGIKRVIELGLEAQSKGELPTAVYCTSPPIPLWPREEEGFVPPTPGLRASSCDTRNSENHPLRHAILNCIASVARLRTVPPFSEIQKQATRNGADYLLTSLSLFTLHEPCTMCTMALLHSRVREVFYVFPSGQSGGFEGELGVHSRKDLNHRFEVWKWKDVDLTDEERELLSIPPGIEV